MAFLDETGLKTFKSKCDSAYAAKNHTHNYAATNHNHDSAYLKLTGGTVTGAITFSGESATAFSTTSTKINRLTKPSSAIWSNMFQHRDLNGKRLGGVQVAQNTNGSIITQVGTSVRNAGDTGYGGQTYIQFINNYDGTLASFVVSPKDSFRTAIGINSGSSVPSSGSNKDIFIQI